MNTKKSQTTKKVHIKVWVARLPSPNKSQLETKSRENSTIVNVHKIKSGKVFTTTNCCRIEHRWQQFNTSHLKRQFVTNFLSSGKMEKLFCYAWIFN